MKAKMEQSPAINPNSVLSVAKNGTVLYSNEASEPLLHKWSVRIGEKLPSSIGELVQRVLSQNNPEKLEVKVGNRLYLVVFHPLPEQKCVNISGFDISDHKVLEEKVPESNAREMANLELGEIVDAQAIQSLMDDFYRLAHIPMSIDDLRGNVLVGVGWQDICTKFHRINPETCKHCVESSTALSEGVLHGEFKQYKCKNNMWHITTPIMVGGKHVGNIISGQFFFEDEPLDYELFRSKARKSGFNEEEYIAALKKAPRLSKKSVDIGMSFFMKLANLISQLSYTTVKLARSLSERNALLEALSKSEEKYRNIIETTNEGIVVIDAEFRITYINKKLAEKGGFSHEEVIGRLWWDFTDEEGKTVAKLHMDKRQRGIDETYELTLIGKDGSLFYVLVSSKSLLDKDGKFAGSLSMFTDITERKKAAEKIKSLANIVESSNDAIITNSLDGIIISWNKGAEQVYGYLAEEVLGKDISILEPENLEGETKQLADEIKQGKKIQHYETLRLKKDGTTINVSVTFSPIFDQSGKFVAISCIAGDITEKKITEKLLHEKQMAEVANRTKSEFLASMSHELRTPLNSIIGFSDMLHEQSYGELNEKQLKYVVNIYKSGKHLLNLINNILDISKVEAGKMELNYKSFELVAKLNMIRNILFPIADRKNIKIEIDMDCELTSICVDEDKFVQIMYNLMDNAIKFSYENSLVKIGARKKGDLVEITVKDTGIGIKIEDQYKLFKPFSQIDLFSSRKHQGTGLGLSLVKKIVHLHGGYVWFRSNPSEGSVFAFAIPINNKGNSEYIELYKDA